MDQWDDSRRGDGSSDEALGELGGATEVPMEALSEGALLGVIDDYILREGTDYGHRDYDLEQKRAQVIKLLKRGDAVILFDPARQSCTVRRRDS